MHTVNPMVLLKPVLEFQEGADLAGVLPNYWNQNNPLGLQENQTAGLGEPGPLVFRKWRTGGAPASLGGQLKLGDTEGQSILNSESKGAPGRLSR